jgi:FkbM family methyltransferase
METTRVPVSLRARRIGRRIPLVRAVRILVQVAGHPSNRQGRLAAIRRAVSWQVRSRLRADRVEIPAYGDTVLLCYPRSNSASNVIYFTPYYDYNEMHFLERYLRAGDVVVDAGANIGTYSLLAATRVGPSGQVIAFEPAPVAFERLRENAARNRLNQVETHGVAVGARVDRAAMRISSDVSNTLVTVPGLAGETAGVEIVRLDDVVGGRRPALIKLDVEGYEFEALQGAVGLLTLDPPPVLLIEFTEHLLRAAGTSPQAFRAWLRDRRYELFDYDAQANELRSVGPLPSGNHFAIRDDARGHVMACLSATTPG